MFSWLKMSVNMKGVTYWHFKGGNLHIGMVQTAENVDFPVHLLERIPWPVNTSAEDIKSQHTNYGRQTYYVRRRYLEGLTPPPPPNVKFFDRPRPLFIMERKILLDPTPPPQRKIFNGPRPLFNMERKILWDPPHVKFFDRPRPLFIMERKILWDPPPPHLVLRNMFMLLKNPIHTIVCRQRGDHEITGRGCYNSWAASWSGSSRRTAGCRPWRHTRSAPRSACPRQRYPAKFCSPWGLWNRLAISRACKCKKKKEKKSTHVDVMNHEKCWKNSDRVTPLPRCGSDSLLWMKNQMLTQCKKHFPQTSLRNTRK